MNCEKTFCPGAPSVKEKSASANALLSFKESIWAKDKSINACVVLSAVSLIDLDIFNIYVGGCKMIPYGVYVKNPKPII